MSRITPIADQKGILLQHLIQYIGVTCFYNWARKWLWKQHWDKKTTKNSQKLEHIVFKLNWRRPWYVIQMDNVGPYCQSCSLIKSWAVEKDTMQIFISIFTVTFSQWYLKYVCAKCCNKNLEIQKDYSIVYVFNFLFYQKDWCFIDPRGNLDIKQLKWQVQGKAAYTWT